MAAVINVMYSSSGIGQIIFDEAPLEFTAACTGGGFRLTIPANLRMFPAANPESIPMVSNLRGSIHAIGVGGERFELGRIRDDSHYNGMLSEYSPALNLTWYGPLAALAACERVRDGKDPRFYVEVNGELCFLIPALTGNNLIRSAPSPMPGQTTIKYPAATWVRMLRKLGVAENVLVEVPLPTSPPAPWDEVWRALVEARDAFEHGGSTGWKATVSSVRLALEKWQSIEPEDHGPGWKAPDVADRRTRTTRQRLDNLRWHLLQCAHQGPHTAAESWSRDDALLMFASLSALLAARNP